jgi:hypothetical protein
LRAVADAIGQPFTDAAAALNGWGRDRVCHRPLEAIRLLLTLARARPENPAGPPRKALRLTPA